MIQKVLIANRGEIALRIMRTCRRMGIATVAVYSDVDRSAPFVLYADQAVHIGEAPPAKSYLDIDKIIAACRLTGADAVHPGYGFLSENVVFAEALHLAGITLIGPSPEAMRVMGSKLGAKAAVAAYRVPMVPGTAEAMGDPQEALKVAEEIGFPVLIKASAGGGGKGMRVVESRNAFFEQMERAVSEATSSFGDGAVFIEKYVSSPRHIEVQIMADNYGHVIHLFERECSIQRRYQKVVEEAPSAILDVELRSRIGQAAINVAKSCEYTGAGTVEFLMDENKNFYFLEMNTRIQVEHPVTEMITGVDLVEWQIRVAQGEPLTIRQEELHINGHAIELRVYAEDPEDNFMPASGKLLEYTSPVGDGIRVDDGYVSGMEIPIFYDPMIAKLVVHAENRKAAISKMRGAIKDFNIKGVKNTLSFGAFVMNHPAFIAGEIDTHFVAKYFRNSAPTACTIEEQIAAKIALIHYLEQRQKLRIPDTSKTNW